MKGTAPFDRDDIAFALARIARDAGDILRAMQHKPDGIRRKADGSPVSDADLAAEALIAAALAEAFPGIPVISEENTAGHAAETGGRFFLVDPLDGTRGFLKGRPDFCVLIALIEQGAPVAGALDAPALGESYWAGERVFRASDRAKLASEQLGAKPLAAHGRTAIVSSSHAREASLARCAALGADQVFSESSALKFARLAAGIADVYPREGKTMQWDVAAGDALLRPLGGGVLDPEGRLMLYGTKAGSWENPPFVAWRSLPAAA